MARVTTISPIVSAVDPVPAQRIRSTLVNTRACWFSGVASRTTWVQPQSWPAGTVRPSTSNPRRDEQSQRTVLTMPRTALSTAVRTMTSSAGRACSPEASPHVPRRDASRSIAARSLVLAHAPTNAEQAAAANAATLEERTRIARELHDSVSQTLYAITLTASRAMKLLAHSEANNVQPIISDVLQLAEAGQSELRALLSDIRSDRVGSDGLIAALTHLAADVRRRTGLDIRLSLAVEPDLPPAVKDELYLISREALHNVVRHARASHVEIALQIEAGEIALLIADDGRGFDPAALRPGHFGLLSMRERAAAIGGTLDLLSANVAGTRVRVRTPATSGAQ
jgi:signal transduction histidine kinase